MKKIILFSLILLSFTTCQKNPFWVGNKEFITVTYSNDGQNGPEVSSPPLDLSHFIDYDTITTRNIGNGTVQVIVDGVRVQSSSNNFEISKINIYEKDQGKFKIQDEFTNLSTSNKPDIATVLVLDMSTSLGNLVTDLKEYAKSFVDQVVNSTDSSIVSVVFFSGKNDISATAFYDHTNAALLKAEIDSFTNYQSRTALFQATQAGIDLLQTLPFSGPKALVVFTDGGDNDSNNPTTLKESIASSDYLRISIGLKGDDFDKNDLQAVADSKANSIVV
ncbi:MAG TPA: VWA domain-containing protein, partial [Bacteroidetes bacterium]|nr:VWA domain-containing protein [Bacteroidota bacterium]